MLAFLSVIALAGCAGDTRHELLISVADQRMVVLDEGEFVAAYPISTSKFGLGSTQGSNKTPLGSFKIKKKIGDNLAPGAVLKHRKPTGEILAVNAPGRDPIVTRILWLDGQEAANRNAYSRFIYIHGTPEETTHRHPRQLRLHPHALPRRHRPLRPRRLRSPRPNPRSFLIPGSMNKISHAETRRIDNSKSLRLCVSARDPRIAFFVPTPAKRATAAIEVF